jgi:hypothetical protein
MDIYYGSRVAFQAFIATVSGTLISDFPIWLSSHDTGFSITNAPSLISLFWSYTLCIIIINTTNAER